MEEPRLGRQQARPFSWGVVSRSLQWIDEEEEERKKLRESQRLSRSSTISNYLSNPQEERQSSKETAEPDYQDTQDEGSKEVSSERRPSEEEIRILQVEPPQLQEEESSMAQPLMTQSPASTDTRHGWLHYPPDILGSGDVPGWFRARYLQVFLLFVAMTVFYMVRVNLGIALVAMTDASASNGFKMFDWTSEDKGVLLSSFFIGYSVSNFASGVLVTRCSARSLLFYSSLYSALASLALPPLVYWQGFHALLILRLTTGIMQSLLMPVVLGQLSRWIPICERASMGTIVLGGIQFGSAVMFVSAGELAESPGGWPSIFYLSGGASLLFACLWWLLAADRPSDTALISAEERDYIETSLQQSAPLGSRKIVIPWGKILTNKAVYALAVVSVTHNWGFWTLMTQMPSYFNAILKYDISSNGWITAMPYLTQWIASVALSFVADLLIRKNVTSITTSRKIFNTLGHWGAAGCLLCLSYWGRTEAVTLAAYTLGVTLLGSCYMGYNINTIDLTPQFAGFLTGITNGLGNVASLFGPLYVGLIVSDQTSIQQWQIVFNTTAALFFAGNLVFVIFGSAKVQKFNNVTDTSYDQEDSSVSSHSCKS